MSYEHYHGMSEPWKNEWNEVFPVNKRVRLDILFQSHTWPRKDMPDWANTAALRMLNMGVGQKRVTQIIHEMELTREAEIREKIGLNGIASLRRLGFDI